MAYDPVNAAGMPAPSAAAPAHPADEIAAQAEQRTVPRRRRTDRARTDRLPFIVAHRGASGVLPEHTLPAFARALAIGADAVEVDLVSTADGRLVARHEPELIESTNAIDRPDLLETAVGDDARFADVGELCTHDLSLRDLTRLRARQREVGRPLEHDDLFMIPTFAQILGLVRRSRTIGGRVPAIHVELKSPALHAELGLPLEREVLRDLAAHGWNRSDAPVLIQSFEADSLLLIAGRSGVPLMQLARLDDEGLARCSNRGLEAIATYAAGIGVSRELLAEVGDDLVARAHARGLVVHVYTFADDRSSDPEADYDRALRLGVDALITDFADRALQARDRWQAAGAPVTQHADGSRARGPWPEAP